ncbi:MAG: hypothetical protein ACLTBV_17535 [Enterocloster bolteae]
MTCSVLEWLECEAFDPMTESCCMREWPTGASASLRYLMDGAPYPEGTAAVQYKTDHGRRWCL